MNEHRPAPAPDAEITRRLGLRLAKRPSRRLTIWIGIAAAAVLIGIGLYYFLGRTAATGYVTAVVARGDLTVTVNATGTLQPQDEVDVGAEISGLIDKVNVDFNDRVKKGQVLAELDTDQLKAKLAQSRASLASAQANVKQFQATLVQTRAKASRTEELFKHNAIAQQDLETAQADLQRANANLQKANADASLAAAQLQADQTTLDKAIIRSPIDGVVLNRNVEPGQSVAASFQTPVLFTLASDLSRMQLQVDIDEADIGSVHEGQSATFTVDAFPQRHFNAKLVSLHNSPKTANGVVTYQGVLIVDNSAHLLRPGLTATADLLISNIHGALLVPNGALRFTPADKFLTAAPPLPDAKEGQKIGRVWILEANKPVPRTVTIGRSDGRSTEIIPGDLKEGDNVITDVKTQTGGAGAG